jgi:hypothetical protein
MCIARSRLRRLRGICRIIRLSNDYDHDHDHGNGKTPSEPIRVPLLGRGNFNFIIVEEGLSFCVECSEAERRRRIHRVVYLFVVVVVVVAVLVVHKKSHIPVVEVYGFFLCV